jgi:predicted SAM-dependent methyltransferase
MEVLNYKNKNYPAFQAEGNASQFAIPFALHFCQGHGVDIGCNRKEWCFPGAIGIDLNFNDGNTAYDFEYENLDYVYSSHCLEHLNNWVDALDYWTSKIKAGGVLFLYLPHYKQEYWRPWNNCKHLHIFSPDIIVDYMRDRNYTNIFNSERDLNDSFMIVGEKN